LSVRARLMRSCPTIAVNGKIFDIVLASQRIIPQSHRKTKLRWAEWLTVVDPPRFVGLDALLLAVIQYGCYRMTSPWARKAATR
jgi:hypothetical protein